MDKMQAKFGDIDWDMAEFTMPPEAVYRDHFMKFGVWNAYMKELEKKPNITFIESIKIAKRLWRLQGKPREQRDRG